MAVTYAWRLDANKYAYLVGPNNEVGYVSTTPLNGTQLATVAKTCNERFGETSGSEGFSEYKLAFETMVENIKDEWGNAQFYDLLSADVYYNVDSSYCADLRGVGIRGIHYLGASEAYDPKNPSWNPSIKQTDTTKLAGKFSLYGIYMDDQEGDETTNLSPERIFAVYNGADGEGFKGDFDTGTLQEMIEAEKETRAAVDSEQGAAIAQLRSDVDALTGLQGGDLSSLMSTITSLQNRILELENAKTILEEQISDLETELEAIKDKSSGDAGVDKPPTTEGGTVDFGEYDGTAVSLVGVGEGNVLYKLDRAVYEIGDIKAKGFYQEDV